MNDNIVRVIAAIAAIGVFAYPYVLPVLRGFTLSAQKDPVKQKMNTIQKVMELSYLFAESGTKEGVDLCNKMIDVLMRAK
jgi:hypothetical protein